MLVVDRGHIVALGTVAELQASAHPRVRQFLDRVPESEVIDELDYLQMLIGDRKTERTV
jgi:phospholipid/cholesterol/gamma-HCH transport system ATP-binding protein